MKKIMIIIMIGLLVFAGNVWAIPKCPQNVCQNGGVAKTWTDVVDLNQGILFGGGGVITYTFTHDITDGINSFQPGIDSITSFTMLLDFADDAYDSSRDLSERAKITLEGIKINYFSSISYNHHIQDKNISFTGAASLNGDGKLDVTITEVRGDFYFKKSTLDATGCDYTINPPPVAPVPVQVPEPVAMLLLGIGMMGVAGCRIKLRQ